MSVYFDAVLNKDYNPVFNGTSQETLSFLKEYCQNGVPEGTRVALGVTGTITSVENYLQNPPTPDDENHSEI
jgi:hypothetical protein